MKQWKAQCSGDVSQAFRPHIDVLEVYKNMKQKQKWTMAEICLPSLKKKREIVGCV